MTSVLMLLGIMTWLFVPEATPRGDDARGQDPHRIQVLVVLAPLDLAPRARAVADIRRLLSGTRGRSDVEIGIVDGPR
jgi:hypothetical protein